MSIPTPHIEAKKEDIARTVIMPGDPLRAKYIADNYLMNVKLVNKVRNMYAYTGYYNKKNITVMGSGMGMPSMGIYSYELFKFYDVENIIRIGTAGGIREDVKIGDIVIAQGASFNSNYDSQYGLNGSIAPIASFDLLYSCYDIVKSKNYRCLVGNILTSDTFYTEDVNQNSLWSKMGIIGIEMETAALYLNAMNLNKKALSICTISDIPDKNIAMTSDERLNGVDKMIRIALELSEKLK